MKQNECKYNNKRISGCFNSRMWWCVDLRPVLVIISLNLIVFSVDASNFETNRVVIHRPSFSSNSNFGYSVAGYKIENDSWILVGAPLTVRERYQSTVIRSREGAVYRCRINVPNSCYMLPFDKKADWHEARDHFGMYYSENKTDQLLGSTLLASDDVILACAPNYRYITRIFRQDDFRLEPTGTCFILKDKMRKFEEHSPCRNSLWGHHRQGYCQAGFSAAISKNDSTLFLTGPGAWYWQGMIFGINMNNKEIKNRYPDRSGEGNNDDSYKGYSIDIAHFDNDIYEDVVVSSPRANNCKGYIEIFSSTFKLLHKINGYQIGAYFGSSLIVVDLNNDNLNDIIVGSPMFKKDTENYDLGRVDVFMREKTDDPNEFLFRTVSINGFKSKSRFGTTIAKLGDINDDGFNDIAVAAPYEDGFGVVYIFHGSEDGLKTTPAQVIKGSQYNLKAFGYSMSAGLDLDSNQYPDLIVGAYKSDAVVYLRSKSVIKTHMQAHTMPRVIDIDNKEYFCDKNKTRLCVDLEFCLEYAGKAVPSNIKMQVSVELDIEKYQNKSLVRAYFLDTKSSMLNFNYTFKHEQKRCFKQTVFIKRAIRDKFTPIKCRVNMTLPNYDTDWELTPMFSSLQDASKIHEIRFMRNCGPDDVCVPNLQVSASTTSKKYVYGSQNYIDLNIRVDNVREDAFEALCHITLPYGVNFVKAFLNTGIATQQTLTLPCYQNKAKNETKIICDIGNPMVAGSMKSFVIRVAPQNILYNQEIIKFNITAMSSNKEDKRTLFDNENFVYVVLDAAPGLTLLGKQYQEQVIYETRATQHKSFEELTNEAEIGPEIMHEYKLMNNGPSQILTSELLVAWQRILKSGDKSREFLYLMEMPYTEGPIKCGLIDNDGASYNLINPLNLTRVSEDRLKNPEKYYISSTPTTTTSFSSLNRKKRHFFSSAIEQTSQALLNYLPKSFYFGPFMSGNARQVNCMNAIVKNQPKSMRYLSMSKLDAYSLFCASLHCRVGPLNTDESALVRLRFRLWSRNLAHNPDIYYVRTHGVAAVTEVPYSKVNLDVDKFQSSIQIETIAHPRERKQLYIPTIDLRIIILSVLAGLALFVLLIILLWKCGFFKRFDPEQKSPLDDEETEDNTSSSLTKKAIVNKKKKKLKKTASTHSAYTRANNKHDMACSTSDEEISSSGAGSGSMIVGGCNTTATRNDVVDLAKECSRMVINGNNIMLSRSNLNNVDVQHNFYTNMSKSTLPQSNTLPYNLANNKLLKQQQSKQNLIMGNYDNPVGESHAQQNNMSTFQNMLLTTIAAPQPHINSINNINSNTMQPHVPKIHTSQSNLYSNPLYFNTAGPAPANDVNGLVSLRKANSRTKLNNESNNNNDLTALLLNYQQNVNQSEAVFTNKLPPAVPRKASKTSLNNVPQHAVLCSSPPSSFTSQKKPQPHRVGVSNSNSQANGFGMR